MSTKKIKTGPLIALIDKSCEDDDVEATIALSNRTKEMACDNDNSTFYHSEKNQTEPYLTIALKKTYFVEKITVVNVHTGPYCEDENFKTNCIMRLDEAKVWVLQGKLIVASVVWSTLKQNLVEYDYIVSKVGGTIVTRVRF